MQLNETAVSSKSQALYLHDDYLLKRRWVGGSIACISLKNETSKNKPLNNSLIDQVVGIHGRIGRFPQNHVAHQRRRTGQIASDSSEIERRNGCPETLYILSCKVKWKYLCWTVVRTVDSVRSADRGVFERFLRANFIDQ